MARLITISFETWSQEDKEIGETDIKGWEDKEGYECRNPSEAIRFLKRNYAVPSDNRIHTVYISMDDDIRTGVETTKTYHLEGFTDRAKRMIWEAFQE